MGEDRVQTVQVTVDSEDPAAFGFRPLVAPENHATQTLWVSERKDRKVSDLRVDSNTEAPGLQHKGLSGEVP